MQTYSWEMLILDFTDSPGLLIIKLAHTMALDMDRRLKSHDVTMSQWSVLKQLWCQEGKSQVELQELLGLDAATVTGLVQRMTHLDLLLRQPDPNDKHVQRVYLTERGRALKQITATLEEEVNSHALQGFSAASAMFARGVVVKQRLRYETPWENLSTLQAVQARLQESHRLCNAFLNAWPDQPHLDITRTLVPSFGPLNAIGIYSLGMAHGQNHLEQLRETVRQSALAKTSQ